MPGKKGNNASKHDIDIALSSGRFAKIPETKKRGRHLPRGGEDTPTPKTRKQRVVAAIKAAALLAAVAIAIALIYNYSGYLTPPNIRRFFRFVGSGFQTSSEQSTIELTISPNTKLAPWRNGFCTASADGLYIFSPDGDSFEADSTYFKLPRLQTTANRILVYDNGGTNLIVSDGEKQLLKLSLESAITGARLGKNGLVVVTAEKGYLSGVTVYDASYKEKFRYRTSDYFAVDALLMPDGTLAFLGVSAGTLSAKTTLLFIDTSSAEITAQYVLDEALPIKMLPVNDSTICLVTDNRLVMLSLTGTELGSVPFGSMSLRAAASGNGFVVCALDRNQAGSQFSVLVAAPDGALISSRTESGGLLGLAAGGDSVALLFPTSVSLCGTDLAVTATLPLSERPSDIVASEDAGFIAVSDNAVTILSR